MKNTTSWSFAPHFALVFAALCAFALLFAGCQTSTSTASPVVQAIQNPNNIAKGIEGLVTVTANRVLAKNPSYTSEVVAAADALVAIANSNPNGFSSDDLTAILSKTKLPATDQAEIVSDFATALGMFQSSFQVSFPTLKPSIAIYLFAVADGIYTATGKTTVPIPTIPWPPVTAPAVTPTPAPSPTPAA